MKPFNATTGALILTTPVLAEINRQQIVSNFNPHRNNGNATTPMQVGNGNFAFSVDVTGLQSLHPFNTLSSWGWHNSSLPTIAGQTSIEDFTGLDWWTHGRLVSYNQPNPAQAAISQWLISNPHRINLGRIGFLRQGEELRASDINDIEQYTDLWTGIIHSSFSIAGHPVVVETAADGGSDTVVVSIDSDLVANGELSVFFDFPYASGKNKFDAPYVGIWNATANHTTTLISHQNDAAINHTLDATTYQTYIAWSGRANIEGPLPSSHRFILSPAEGSNSLKFTTEFALDPSQHRKSAEDVFTSSTESWNCFWSNGGFVSLSADEDPRAEEIMRRNILSQYLLKINSASTNEMTQESGLVNNGWYGKFHLEMPVWHLMHWLFWNRGELTSNMLPGMYERYLQSSIVRATDQGYLGAKWGKMTDPSGRSAPGEINSLLIWQQPHPMYFAEAFYQLAPTQEQQDKVVATWAPILSATADYMASYAFWNSSKGVYDLGPPMYPSSENTNPNLTMNAAYELAYWAWGLDVAANWQQRQGLPVPEPWTHVRENLASLPVDEEGNTYVIYEGIPDMWQNTTFTADHPSQASLLGFLPSISPATGFEMPIMNNTFDAIMDTWNLTESFGWDFPLLAMAASRLGRYDEAVDLLLNENFGFDDVGMPIGGVRVPTPYFPGSGSLLMAIAVISGVWGGESGASWPTNWLVETENLPVLDFSFSKNQ